MHAMPGSKEAQHKEATMDDYLSSKGLCSVCREAMTTVSAEVGPGKSIFVCKQCLETAKQNFIWICMHCGSVFIRPKILVLKRLTDPELKRAYYQCADMQIIQGIDLCVECDPEGVVEVVSASKTAKNGGHC